MAGNFLAGSGRAVVHRGIGAVRRGGPCLNTAPMYRRALQGDTIVKGVCHAYAYGYIDWSSSGLSVCLGRKVDQQAQK
jgi:hypothetical protein